MLCNSGQGAGAMGEVWECPVLCRLQGVSPRSSVGSRVGSSAWPHSAPITNTNANMADQIQPPASTSTQGATTAASFLSVPGPPEPHRDIHTSTSYFFSVSPDACTNPTFFWIGDVVHRRPLPSPAVAVPEAAGSCRQGTGSCRQGTGATAAGGDGCSACITFDLGSASGPYRLDLGDVLYAPNLVRCPSVG